MDEALNKLRDIHLPEPVSWWPPAIGWWILMLLLVFFAILFARRVLIKRRRLAPLKAAVAAVDELDSAYLATGDTGRLVQDLSVLLRRIALTLETREQVASLGGEAWLQHLDTLAGDTHFHTDLGRALLLAPYELDPEVDGKALLDLSRDWLEGVRRHV